MAVTYQSIYRFMDEALKYDKENQHQVAYCQYLRSIAAASSYMLNGSLQNNDDEQKIRPPEILKLMEVIKMCVSRLEAILENPDSATVCRNISPPSYEEAIEVEEEGACTSVNSAVQRSFEETDSWNEVSTTDDSIVSGFNEDASSDDINYSPTPAMTDNEPRPNEISKMNEESPIEVAVKKNKILVKHYRSRLQNLTTSSSRVQTALELQRRLVDNLKCAENEQKVIKEKQKKRQNETFQKVRRKLHDVVDEKGSNMAIADPTIKDLCRKCISYEQNQEQTWPNDLRDSLSVDINPRLVSYICHETLNALDYPLSKWLSARQKEIKEKLNVQVQPHGKLLRQISHPDWYKSDGSSPNSLRTGANATQMPGIESEQMIQLQNFNDQIKRVVEISSQVLLLMYLDIEKVAEGKEICSRAVEEQLFKVIWSPLCRLYRLAYHQEEIMIKEVIGQCRSDPLKYLDLDRISEMDLNDVLPKAVCHFKEIVRMSCPSHKIDKLISVFMLLGNRGNNKSMGADELIPMLTYIFVMCDTPELIPEIHCMHHFLSDREMFGQKGYCISSMQTVLAYILTLHVPQDADD